MAGGRRAERCAYFLSGMSELCHDSRRHVPPTSAYVHVLLMVPRRALLALPGLEDHRHGHHAGRAGNPIHGVVRGHREAAEVGEDVRDRLIRTVAAAQLHDQLAVPEEPDAPLMKDRLELSGIPSGDGRQQRLVSQLEPVFCRAVLRPQSRGRRQHHQRTRHRHSSEHGDSFRKPSPQRYNGSMVPAIHLPDARSRRRNRGAARGPNAGTKATAIGRPPARTEVRQQPPMQRVATQGLNDVRSSNSAEL